MTDMLEKLWLILYPEMENLIIFIIHYDISIISN